MEQGVVVEGVARNRKRASTKSLIQRMSEVNSEVA
jgi:hypothetical protein